MNHCSLPEEWWSFVSILRSSAEELHSGPARVSFVGRPEKQPNKKLKKDWSVWLQSFNKRSKAMCRTWRAHLLKLFDDFFIFVQVRLVCSVHTCNTHTHTHTHRWKKNTSWQWLNSSIWWRICSLINVKWVCEWAAVLWGASHDKIINSMKYLPGLESRVLRFFSFLTFICLAISPERNRQMEKGKH